MSLIALTNAHNIPVLLGDSLISGPDNTSSLSTPDHPRGISSRFPVGSGFVPTGMARKLFIINPNVAVGMTGSVVHMRSFVDDIQHYFASVEESSEEDVKHFLTRYAEEEHGRIVTENIDAFLLVSEPSGINELRGKYFLLTLKPNMPGLLEADTQAFNRVFATGCDQQGFESAIQALDRYKFGGTGPRDEWSNIYDALSKNLTLISQLHKKDELTAELLLNYWGGGYEVIYRNGREGLKFLEEYTILFFYLDLDQQDGHLEPDGFLKYDRRDEISLITSYRQGIFNMTGFRDVGELKRPFVVEDPEEGYFNAQLMMSLVCTIQDNKITGMYHWCHRHEQGKASPSFLRLREDSRVETLISQEFDDEMSRYIREVESSRQQ